MQWKKTWTKKTQYTGRALPKWSGLGLLPKHQTWTCYLCCWFSDFLSPLEPFLMYEFAVTEFVCYLVVAGSPGLRKTGALVHVLLVSALFYWPCRQLCRVKFAGQPGCCRCFSILASLTVDFYWLYYHLRILPRAIVLRSNKQWPTSIALSHHKAVATFYHHLPQCSL